MRKKSEYTNKYIYIYIYIYITGTAKQQAQGFFSGFLISVCH